MLHVPMVRLGTDLARLAAMRATGELFAAAEGVEIHVFLLEGRLAWATSSSDKTRLTGYLVERHGIEPARIRAALEECKRTNRSFAGVLMEQKVATHEQVREMLFAQIARAVATLSTLPAQHVAFRPRRLDYSIELTFALDEVLESARPDAGPETVRSGPLSEAGPESKKLVIPGAFQSAAESGRRETSAAVPGGRRGLGRLRLLEGFLGACVFDSHDGSMLGVEGDGASDLEVACATDLDMVRATQAGLLALGLDDEIEDIVVTLGEQYHLIRPMTSHPALLFYMMLDRRRANLAMSRIALADAERASEPATFKATALTFRCS